MRYLPHLMTVSAGVVGATGVAGDSLVSLLRERGLEPRLFASEPLPPTPGVEEPSAEALSGLDLCFFADGAELSRRLLPVASAAGALCVDRSSAFRLEPGTPLVVPEVNGDLAVGARAVASPGGSTIPLVRVLKPLADAAGLRSVQVATYQAASGAGREGMRRLSSERAEWHDLGFDWPQEGAETLEEVKLRRETQKILGLPELRLSATTVRVPVMLGHAEAVWVETLEPLSAPAATAALEGAPGLRLDSSPTPRRALGSDLVLVGRVREDPARACGLLLFLACDNLRCAAQNELGIAESMLGARLGAELDVEGAGRAPAKQLVAVA